MIQNFLVDAAIWNHPVERWVTRARIIEQPQALLRGLGLASRLYASYIQAIVPCILASSARHMSFKVCCPRFEDSGLGVVCQVGKSGGMGEGLKIASDTAARKEALGAAEPAEL